MTLQARKASQKRSPATVPKGAVAVERAPIDLAPLACLARLAATEGQSTVASALARHICESTGADGAIVVEYGGTPGRLTVAAAHGDVDLQPGSRIPASPLLTPLAEPIAAGIIDSAARGALPGTDKPRAVLSAPIPGPYAPTGAIVALFDKPKDFSAAEISLIELAASLLGAAQQKESAATELAATLDARTHGQAIGRSREHAVLAGMAKAAAESPDLETALASICEWTAEIVPYDRMVVGLIEEDPPSFTRAVYAGEGAEGRPAGERFLMSADELEELGRPAAGVGEPATKFGGEMSGLRAPMAIDGRLVGVLWLGSRAVGGYTGGAADALGRVADYLAPIVESAITCERSRAAVRQAAERSHQMAAILAAAPVALVAVDASGICTVVEGRLVRDIGAISQLLKGHSLFELMGRHPQVEEAVRAALRGIPGSTVLQFGKRHFDLSVQPVLSTSGGVDGAIIVGTEVTERVAGRAALAEVKHLQLVEDERARLMSAVSHELKTPLTSIVAFIDVLAANQPGNLTEKQAQALAVVQKSAEQLGRLIGDLHDLARLEAGIFTLDVKRLDPGSLLQYLLDTHQPLLAVRRQSLIVENQAQDWEVAADEVRVLQAVSNLLSNASKYSPEETEVRLTAAVNDGRLELTVVDQGPGIPEALRERVFDAGYRIENRQTRGTPGSGLGLAIVRRIVDLHGGVVSLRCGEAGGTTVSVAFPGARRRKPSGLGQTAS